MVSFAPVALVEKGLIRFSQGNFEAAAQHFADAVARAVAMAQGNPGANLLSQRAAVWLYLAQARNGRRDESALARNAAALGADKTDEALAAFFLGKITRDEFLAAYGNARVRAATRAQCEAPFFLGQWHLLRKETALAKGRFEEIRKNCPRHNIEALLAGEELRRLAP
jgi:rhomboid protease GluP